MDHFGSPLIVIGMHRSGTSMVTEKLHLAGLFMGEDRDHSHSESQFFLGLNQYVYQLAHADWDNPLPMCWMLEDEALSETVAKVLSSKCDSVEFSGFTCGQKEGDAQVPRQLLRPWGWKDPRNTFTLPLWLRVFPNAKVLNIVRNGVDVAQSLITRENKRRLRLDSPPRSSRCMNLNRSFDLWAEYVEMGEGVCEGLGADKVLTISYEQFLDRPAEILGEIVRFAGVESDDELLRAITRDIDSTRAYSYKKNSSLERFFESRTAHPLMIRHGYRSAHPLLRKLHKKLGQLASNAANVRNLMRHD